MPKEPDVVGGEPILASWGNQGIRDKTVQRMTSAADLAASFPAPTNGDTAWVQDTGSLQIWDGTRWKPIVTVDGAAFEGPVDMGNFAITNQQIADLVATKVGQPYSLAVGFTNGDPSVGDSTVLSVMAQDERACQIAISKNSGVMFYRGIDGAGPAWGTWQQVQAKLDDYTEQQIALEGLVDGTCTVRKTLGALVQVELVVTNLRGANNIVYVPAGYEPLAVMWFVAQFRDSAGLIVTDRTDSVRAQLNGLLDVKDGVVIPTGGSMRCYPVWMIN